MEHATRWVGVHEAQRVMSVVEIDEEKNLPPGAEWIAFCSQHASKYARVKLTS